jgi:sucrose phosphorylase
LGSRGYLDETELNALVEEVKKRGGLIGYKATPQGDIPYELNVNYRDAVAEASLDDSSRSVKFLSSQAIMLAMAGVPGIYIHSLLGSGNWKEGVEITGANRTINREKLSRSDLEAKLDDPGSLQGMIFRGYRALLEARRSHQGFHPAGGQRILDLGPGVFALVRTSIDGNEHVVCLQSVVGEKQSLELPSDDLRPASGSAVRDIISGRDVDVDVGSNGGWVVTLAPWEVLWLDRG